MEGSLFYRQTTLEDAYLQQILNRLLRLNLKTIRNLSLDLFPPCPTQIPVLETGNSCKTSQIYIVIQYYLDTEKYVTT